MLDKMKTIFGVDDDISWCITIFMLSLSEINSTYMMLNNNLYFAVEIAMGNKEYFLLPFPIFISEIRHWSLYADF